MGYYTQHELAIIKGSNDLIEELINDCEEAGYALEVNGDCRNECKWYDHKKDLIEFSKKHPDALLELSGVGEEHGDAWKEYYHNGKVQVCKAKLVYPEFNPELLE